MRGSIAQRVTPVLAMLAAACPMPAGANGITVSQTTIVLHAGQDAHALTVVDPSAEPVRVQARLFRWHGGESDVYEPTQDIGFSPAIFTIEPGAAQIVRMVVQTPRAAQETAYRLFVDELPPPPRAGKIMLPVRLVIPVFVEGTRPAGSPALLWTASMRAGQLALTASNDGATRARVSDLGYRENGRDHMIAAGLAGYVLAGDRHVWSFPFHGTALEISAHTEQGDIHQSVPLTSP